MLPDIDSLALFVRAAELGNLTKTAEVSNIGVAGASRRIMLLEARLKTTLFDRSHRGLSLTAAGKCLLADAKAVLQQMNDMQLKMKHFAVEDQDALHVLANSSVMLEPFLDGLAAFQNAHAGVDVIVEERWSREIVRAVTENEADLGIIAEGLPTEGLKTSFYKNDTLAVLLPTGHKLHRARELRFATLLEHDLVTLESGSAIMRLLFEQAALTNMALRPKVLVRSFEAICRMVSAGRGIGILPLDVAEMLGMGTDANVILRPLHESWARRKMLFCVRAERAPNPLLSKLLQHLAAGDAMLLPVGRRRLALSGEDLRAAS